MAISVTAQLQGTEEAQRRIAAIVPRLVSADAQRIFLAIARTIERAIERRQPQRDSGRLKRATVARGVSAAQVFRRGPAAFVLVRTRERDADAAPYAYPIESGQREKRPQKGKVLVFRSGGKLVFARRIKEIKARPFFEPAVRETGAAALEQAAEGMERLILRLGR